MGPLVSHVGGLTVGHAMRTSAARRGQIAVHQYILLGPKPFTPTISWCVFAVAVAFLLWSCIYIPVVALECRQCRVVTIRFFSGDLGEWILTVSMH